MDSKISSALRFSHVVENYIKFRPGYPTALLQILKEKTGLKESSVIADVGSGTGKSSELFLENGNLVYGIEPNSMMREAAEFCFRNRTNFKSIGGKAEETTLPVHRIDIIICGQAFHWFDKYETRKEFLRILKPDGWVVLIWNDRDNETPFSREYENFIQINSVDYSEVNHRNVTPIELNEFFSRRSYTQQVLPYIQHFDFEGLKGRYLSCSYAYKENHPLFNEAIEKLKRIFERYENNGKVEMSYTTKIYLGQL